MFRLIVFLAAMLVAAPAAMAADKAPADREPTAEEAKIVVYRVTGYLRIRAFTVEINDIDAIKLNEGQHSWLYLKAGAYKLEVDLPWDIELFGTNRPAERVLEGGQTYYFRLLMSLETAPDGGFREKGTVTQVTEAQAKAEMKSPSGFVYPTGYRKPQPGYARLGALDH